MVNPIILKDNKLSQVRDFGCSCGIICEALKAVAGKKLSQLSESNFIVFPPIVKDADLKHDDVVLSYKADGEKLCFTTGNVMGFFGIGEDYQFQIQSRFDSDSKNYFLHYMLQKVCNVAFTPRASVGEDSFYDFIYFLFPAYLRSAINQGVYRAYVTREYNDANVRGPIDVARHIRHNIPFNGKIAYHTREYTTDNNITQLIRHTIEFIRTLTLGAAVLNSGDGKVLEDVSAIVASTPSYSKNDRIAVIAKNLRPVTHPYYTAYEPLRKLCLAILRHQKLSYGESSNDAINGILFDGAALWEEYLNKVMHDGVGDVVGYGGSLLHPNNRKGEDTQWTFRRKSPERLLGKIYPDFLLDCKYEKNLLKSAKCILDAKYKDIGIPKGDSVRNVPGSDLNQMLLYMVRYSSKLSLILHPVEQKHAEEYKDLGYEMLGDPSYVVKTVPFIVPECKEGNDFEKFCDSMKETEVEFLKLLKSHF